MSGLPRALGTVLAARFRLDEVLGEGAMGVVFRAADLAGGPDVAVKLMHPRFRDDARMLARFDREARAGAVLEHRHCVRVLGAGTSPGGDRFLVMQLVRGESLRDAIDAGIAPRRAFALAAQLLEALAHVHGHGFVHRDVKPENILLVREADGGETLKLLDLGLVREEQPSPRGQGLTRLGALFGTPWYMAPEQAEGAVVDARADLYAAGAVLFEMIAGRPPFLGDSLVEVLSQHLHAEVPALPSWLPRSLDGFVRTLLAKRPADRPASAAAALTGLRAALARAAASPTVVPTRASVPMALQATVDEPRPPSMLRGAQRQQRWFVGLGALAAAIALAIGLGHGASGASVPAIVDAPAEASPVAAALPAVPAVAVQPPALERAAPVSEVATSVPSEIAIAPQPALSEPAITTPVVAGVAPEPATRGAAVEHSQPHSSARRNPSHPRVPSVRELPPPPRDEVPRTLHAVKPPRAVPTATKLPGEAGASTVDRSGSLPQLRPRVR
ncbi:MAG: protein kinase [Nannocystaceae bacterium]|nr:protein kinase [Nannocystaceae bacterium]